MKIKCYDIATGSIAYRLRASNYKDLIASLYGDLEEYENIKNNPDIIKHFQRIWFDLNQYEVCDDRHNSLGLIFINCS